MESEDEVQYEIICTIEEYRPSNASDDSEPPPLIPDVITEDDLPEPAIDENSENIFPIEISYELLKGASQRGKDMLSSNNGHLYLGNGQNLDTNTAYCRCILYQSEKCRARVICTKVYTL